MGGVGHLGLCLLGPWHLLQELEDHLKLAIDQGVLGIGGPAGGQVARNITSYDTYSGSADSNLVFMKSWEY